MCDLKTAKKCKLCPQFNWARWMLPLSCTQIAANTEIDLSVLLNHPINHSNIKIFRELKHTLPLIVAFCIVCTERPCLEAAALTKSTFHLFMCQQAHLALVFSSDLRNGTPTAVGSGVTSTVNISYSR